MENKPYEWVQKLCEFIDNHPDVDFKDVLEKVEEANKKALRENKRKSDIYER